MEGVLDPEATNVIRLSGLALLRGSTCTTCTTRASMMMLTWMDKATPGSEIAFAARSHAKACSSKEASQRTRSTDRAHHMMMGLYLYKEGVGEEWNTDGRGSRVDGGHARKATLDGEAPWNLVGQKSLLPSRRTSKGRLVSSHPQATGTDGVI